MILLHLHLVENVMAAIVYANGRKQRRVERTMARAVLNAAALRVRYGAEHIELRDFEYDITKVQNVRTCYRVF